MGNGPGPSSLEIAERLHAVEADILHQKHILKELETEGHSCIGTVALLRLLEQEREKLPPQP